MKNMQLIVWLTQLGLSVALPPTGFILLAVWLQNRFAWGNWVIWAGIVLGVVGAIDGLRVSLKAMERMSREENKDRPVVSFNDHE